MKSHIIYLPLNSERKGRNHKTSLFLNEIPKIISSRKSPPSTTRIMKKIPILLFPLSIDENDSNFPTYFLTSTLLYNHPPLSLKRNKIFKNIFPNTDIYKNMSKTNYNNFKKTKLSKSLFNKPVIVGKSFESKIKEVKNQKN